MAKIAIIKIGATGDVVRTSVLLHLFRNDEITWITAKHNIPVLPFRRDNLTAVLALEDIGTGSLPQRFDLVVSLDDDLKCASLASRLDAAAIFGAYAGDGKVQYTDDAREWFDMGLSSRLGKQEADRIKWLNQDSYQEILFRMLGHEFRGEEYLIREDVTVAGRPGVIGIEARAGARWPTKVWHRYADLANVLRAEGNEVVFFEDREQMKDYMQDIGNVSVLIGGDTLGMHIALALKIPLVTIFTCTSATEIYGYGRMTKLVSPFLQRAFYRTEYIPEAVESITLEEVAAAVRQLSVPQA